MKLILTTACAAALIGGGALVAADRNSADRNAPDPAKASKEVVQDIKTTTDSGTSKMTIDTVYGKVEAYDLNKSLKVSVPGKVVTSKTYDLTSKNETMNVAPGLKVGDWVKAQEKTDNDGHKTVTVESWNERTSR
jgi:archaellum component FlaG (FlaF/FlaG flagellin family)